MDIFNTLANVLRPEPDPKQDVFILIQPFGAIGIGSILHGTIKNEVSGSVYTDITTKMATGDIVEEYDIPGKYLQAASASLTRQVYDFLNAKNN